MCVCVTAPLLHGQRSIHTRRSCVVSDDNGSVLPEDNNTLSPKNGATEEGISLNVLTMEELQGIVRNEKYRPLLNELPMKGDIDTQH